MPTGNLTKVCRWVLASGDYCKKPVKYQMVHDGGEPGAPLIRYYLSFCEDHDKKSDDQDEDDD